MSFLSAKKLLLFGLILMLLIGIPAGVYLVQQDQENRSRAEKSTITSFEPESTTASPIPVTLGEEFTIDMIVNPGINLVSAVTYEITYDATKIAVAEENPFTVNAAAFPVTMDGPIFTPGKIVGTISIGANPTQAIQTTTRMATVKFKALAATEGTPTIIRYNLPTTQAKSLGPTDQAAEDVLSTTSPAYISITAGGEPTPTPSGPVATPTRGPVPTTPTPTTSAPTPTTLPTVSPTPGGTGGGNQAPLCTGLISSTGTSGIVPFSSTFTATGNDSDGTIAKVTFNFGDSQVFDVTDPGVVGVATVSATTTHTYNTAGTYQVSAVMTDDGGAASQDTTCQQTITVDDISPTASAAPTLEPTGPSSNMVSIGVFVGILTFIGGLLFFAL